MNGTGVDVETAVEIGTDAIAGGSALIAVVIPQLHAEMAVNLLTDTRWRTKVRDITTNLPD